MLIRTQVWPPISFGFDSDQRPDRPSVSSWSMASEGKQRLPLSSLTAEQLRARATVYRDMAAMARSTDRVEPLLRLAELFDAVATSRGDHGNADADV